MPHIAPWNEFPAAIRRHLIDRMAQRQVSISDLNLLRLWVETNPEVPDGDWYKDFSTFKICGAGKFPKTFLMASQIAKGKSI